MSYFLFRIGHYAGRHPWRVLASWAIIATSVVLLNSAYGGSSTEEFSIPGAESQKAADALEDRFPQETLYTSTIVFHSPEGLKNGPTKAAISRAVSRLADGRPRGRHQRSLRSEDNDPEPGRDNRPRDHRVRHPGNRHR